MSAPLQPGERVVLIDDRGRRLLIRLEAGQSFHFHGGIVPHDLIIGAPDGVQVHSTTGAALICVRPRLADFILKMGRGAQVIYPKDIGPILVYSDVFPGARVLEAGTGSGALTMALCRAVGPEGLVVSYEVRPEHLDVARANIEAFFGKLPAWLDLRLGDVREAAAADEPFDRLLLDLPEPWGILETAETALAPSGILCAYLPTTGQVQQLVAGLQDASYGEIETFEVMLRTWHVTPVSVRPDHRMVGHTGFVTIARRSA